MKTEIEILIYREETSEPVPFKADPEMIVEALLMELSPDRHQELFLTVSGEDKPKERNHRLKDCGIQNGLHVHPPAQSPFCPKLLAGLHDIIVEETATPMDGEGQILPRRGKTVIQYKAGILPQRQRFTICHELAHTCFPDVFELVRNRGAESDEDKAHRQFENLCHAGAGELLLPAPEFHQAAMGHLFDGKLVHALSAKFDASLDATIKRIIECSTEPCGAAFLTDEAFSEFRAWKERSRVVWYWHHDAMKGYIPKGTLVPANSVCNTCIGSCPSFRVALVPGMTLEQDSASALPP